MRAAHTRLAVALLTSVVLVPAAQAQTSAACVNDAPMPYHLVNDWAHTPRPWAQTNNVSVDARDNVWVFDRCEDGGCAASKVAPIWELSSDGKVLKNFGAGMFVFPHQVVPQRDGSVWVVDGQAKDGKGMQVTKFSPDGKVVMTLGKAGQGGKELDVFDQPTSVAIASNGDIFVSEGHAPTFGNSRIMQFDKSGKFIKTFGHLGSGDGELKGPHVLAFDSQGRLFVADRSNSRVVIFDRKRKVPGCVETVRPAEWSLHRPQRHAVCFGFRVRRRPGQGHQQSRLQERRADGQREDGQGRGLHPAAAGV